MTSNAPNGKRFHIERLEERVAPGCVFWTPEISDGVSSSWTGNAGATTQESIQFIANQTDVPLRKSIAAEFMHGPDAHNKDRHGFPVWGERLLSDVDKRFNIEATETPAARGTSQAGQATGADGSSASKPQLRKRFGLPGWAEIMLSDIDHMFNGTSDQEARPPAKLPAVHETVTDKSQAAAPKPKDRFGLPGWAEKLLSDIDQMFNFSGRSNAVTVAESNSTTLDRAAQDENPGSGI